jgi:hypothetical protein
MGLLEKAVVVTETTTAVAEARGQFRNPEEGESPQLKPAD